MLIRNIWAVGRNYEHHAKELGNPVPTTPFIFLKAGSSASVNSTEIVLPHFAQEIHHEVELALKFSSHLHVVEAAVALDLTDRPVQIEAKKLAHPWTLAKSFHNACAVSSFFRVKSLSDLQDLEIKLWVNDDLRQQGRTSEMIFGIDQLIEFVKIHFPVCPGDLLLTGTPKGVGPLRHGDVVKAQIHGQITHTWKVIQEPKPVPKNP
jgi:acylpyruvate hydrolase